MRAVGYVRGDAPGRMRVCWPSECGYLSGYCAAASLVIASEQMPLPLVVAVALDGVQGRFGGSG